MHRVGWLASGGEKEGKGPVRGMYNCAGRPSTGFTMATADVVTIHDKQGGPSVASAELKTRGWVRVMDEGTRRGGVYGLS